MNLGSVPVVPAGDTFLNSAVAPGRPGSQVYTRDGRRFRLIKSGNATVVGPSNLLQSPAANNGHLGLIPIADVPVGSLTFRVTAGSGAGTNAPANTYAGGLAIVSTGAGTGISMAIKSHDAIVALAAFTVVLESDSAVPLALTAASSRIDLIANPYLGAFLNPTPANVAGVIGVTVANIDPGNWGYVQVEGLSACVADGAVAIGQAVSPSPAISGAVVINSTTLPVIGSALQAGVATRAFAVSLQLP